MVDAETMHKQVLVLRLISKFRTLGMFYADLDPLQRHEPQYLPDLDLRTYGFTEADLTTEFDVGSFKGGPARMRLADIIAALKETYTRTLGTEYMYISDTHTKRFFQQRLEPIRATPSYSPRRAPPHPRAPDRRGNAGALPAHEICRPEALLGRGRPRR